jgi:hypothetical protein
VRPLIRSTSSQLPPIAAARRTARRWVASGVLLLVCVVYVASFWSRLTPRLPEPLNRWGFVWDRLASPVWQTHVAPLLPSGSATSLRHLTIDCVFGLVLPLLVALAFHRGGGDFGLRRPNALGWRLVLLSVVLSIPIGLWLLTQMGVSHETHLRWPLLRDMLSMVPEHFFICGLVTAVVLEGCRLPRVVAAPVDGTVARRVLRWIGLAQPPVAGVPRGLSWFGLTWAGLVAVLASGAVFGFVHLGKNPVELAASVPGGIVVAYMTLRTGSILPALLAHWTMNIIPWLLFWTVGG